MFKNYLKIAWRNLRKNKLTSFINIFGLTISIGICLLISLFIYEETSYDKFEKGYEQIFRAEQIVVNGSGTKIWAASPALFKDILLDKFSEVESSTRLLASSYAFIKVGDKLFKEENCFQVDSTFFEALGLSLLKGDAKKALSDPSSVVITEKIAKKLFNEENALGQTIEVNSSPFKITGILKDLPENSHLQISILRSFMLSKDQPLMNNWGANAVYTYVRLKKGVNPNMFPDKFANELVKMHYNRNKQDLTFRLHNIADIHLGGNIEKELSSNSSWVFVYIFISIGFLVLLLASINYINLTTSRSLERSKEIGLRKAIGAFKKNLITQFMTESVLITLISFGLALLLVYLSLPVFNWVAAKQLSIAAILNPFFILTSIGIIIFIGVLAGTYPAFVIASFDPVNTLKGVVANNLQSGFSFRLRKGLVVFQFVISAFLVIASLVVIKQISYMFDKPLGFNKENVMNLPAMNLNESLLNNIRTSLKDNSSIIDISATSATPGKRVILGGITFPGQSQMTSLRTMFVDYNYLKTMQVAIVNGRDFDRTISSDSTTNIIINEAAAKSFNLKNPIGNNAWLLFYNTNKPATIIGVAKDFHQGSLHNAIEPTIFVIEPIYYSMLIRFKGDPEKVKQDLSAVWGKYFPNELFTYSLLDDDLKKLYKSESTFKNILLIFTVLAIVIASLGLFGLIYFSNALRRKEIGVRKVLGAANSKIVYLLSKDYIILIAISLIISIPLSNYALHKWLENFAYRTDVSIANYFIGTLITLIISLCTVLLQGIMSALSNPTKSLRME